MPEEIKRRIVDIVSDVNLAYSEYTRRYLANCGLPKETGAEVYVYRFPNLAGK